MSMFIMDVPNMDVSTSGVPTIKTPILGDIKMGVSNMGTLIKAYLIEDTPILGGTGLFGVLAGFAPTNRIFVGS
jgi:hypothetical protein